MDAGEDYKEAAERELEEELGLRGLELEEVGRYRSDETWRKHRHYRFTQVYRVRANVQPKHLEEGKIDGVRWFTLDEVKALIRDHPDQVSDGLLQVIPRYY